MKTKKHPKETTNKMAVTYLRICCVMSMGIVFFSIYEKLLQATGNSLYSTIAQIAGAITNIVLDPIMIYGLLGLPEMGVAGAAWATVIGQIVSLVLALVFHLRKNTEVQNHIRYLRPQGSLIREIYVISLSFVFAGANVAFQGIFQALESGLESLVISVCRQMLFVLPVAYGFSLIARMEKDKIWLVWLTFLLAEALSCAIACGFMARLWKRKIKEA